MHLCKFFSVSVFVRCGHSFFEYTPEGTTRVRNNTATHVFHSQQLNKFNFHLNLFGWFSCELLVCQETPRKKSQGFRSGLRGGQNFPQLWQPGKGFDLTRLAKSVFKKPSTTFSVCGLTPACINPWVCRGKAFAKRCVKKSFWSICKYRSDCVSTCPYT